MKINISAKYRSEESWLDPQYQLQETLERSSTSITPTPVLRINNVTTFSLQYLSDPELRAAIRIQDQ